jgi:adenosylcobinamide-GDP ribazoletransferase
MPAASPLRTAAAAVTFLTKVPLGARMPVDAPDVARGSVLFPLVGGAIGAVVGLVAVGLDIVVPALVAAALAVATEAVITGAIHLDALADAADGLGGGTPERALEIMRDPRLGAFGAVGLALDLILKTAAVAALLDHERTVLVLLAAWSVGRAAPLALAAVLPSARETPGTAGVLSGTASTARLTLGVVIGIAIAAAAGERALGLLAASALCLLVVAVTARARFRGVTGDVLGAAVELTTTFALVGATASL